MSLKQGFARLVLVMLAAGTVTPAWSFWDPVTSQCRGPAMAGTAHAVDGDTLQLETGAGDTVVLRLVAIEAPELLQQCRDAGGEWDCGLEARATLDGLLAGRTISCTPCGYAADGATFAACRDGEADLGAALLATGMATTNAFFSNTLHAAQWRAQRARLGLWRGDWVNPRAWRDGARLGPAPCAGCLQPQ